MASETKSPASAPVTIDGLMSQRKAFWASFTKSSTIAAAVVAGIVVLMAIFLVK